MANNRILIFGWGYLANKIDTYLRYQYDVYISNVDITNYTEVLDEINTCKPIAVINAAGKTNLDMIEKVENRSQAFDVNVKGASNIAFICISKGIYFVHLSSGCIFDGIEGSGFKEDSIPNPKCYYAWTKYFADSLLLPLLSYGSFSILRIRLPVDKVEHKRNLITKLRNFDFVVDYPNSITVIEDLCHVISTFIKMRISGLYNATNPGVIYLEKIIEMMRDRGLVDRYKVIELISREDYDKIAIEKGLAKRASTVLNTSKIESIIPIRNIHDAIHDCIENYERL